MFLLSGLNAAVSFYHWRAPTLYRCPANTPARTAMAGTSARTTSAGRTWG